MEYADIFRVIKMRPTPFSSFYPESYRALTNPSPRDSPPTEKLKSKYDLSKSFYAREYAKIKLSAQYGGTNPNGNCTIDFN